MVLVKGDTKHILINAASSLLLGYNKHTHYLSFLKDGGRWRGDKVSSMNYSY